MAGTPLDSTAIRTEPGPNDTVVWHLDQPNSRANVFTAELLDEVVRLNESVRLVERACDVYNTVTRDQRAALETAKTWVADNLDTHGCYLSSSDPDALLKILDL